jgi:hypothetical protein
LLPIHNARPPPDVANRSAGRSDGRKKIVKLGEIALGKLDRDLGGAPDLPGRIWHPSAEDPGRSGLPGAASSENRV